MGTCSRQTQLADAGGADHVVMIDQNLLVPLNRRVLMERMTSRATVRVISTNELYKRSPSSGVAATG